MVMPPKRIEIDPQARMLDIFIVNFNTAHLLPPMLAACQQAAHGLDVRYWVVDNASQDDSVAVLREQFPQVGLVVNARNVGFGRANNQLLSCVTGDYVLLLNTDAFVSSDTLQCTLAYMQSSPDCGVLGVKLTGCDGVLQPSCRYFPTPWNVFLNRTGLSRFFSQTKMVDNMAWDHASVRECDWVPGCYYLVRREVLDQVGLFDSRFFLYYEEVDHCMRVKQAGWKVVYYPDTTVVHVGGESAKTAGNLSESGRQLSALQVESELLYFRKHFGWKGLATHLVFTVVAGAGLVLKSLLKREKWIAMLEHVKHVVLVFRLVRETRCATHPTR